MTSKHLPAAFFGMVLGLSGLGQCWRVAHHLWALPAIIGEIILAFAAMVWGILLIAYIAQVILSPGQVKQEFLHPVQGGTPALLGIATLLISLAVVPWSHAVALVLAVIGIGWHLGFSLWHTGIMWQGGRIQQDTLPTLYLPGVAGNFTSAAALGTLGYGQWGWLFLGTGVFSWLAIESPILLRLWDSHPIPPMQRPLLGIQFAPPVVCLMAVMILMPGEVTPWLLMLWGYGLFQLLLGMRLYRWLGQHAFTPAWWAYSFGVVAACLGCLKLALAGISPAHYLSIPVFVATNLFIGYFALHTMYLFIARRLR